MNQIEVDRLRWLANVICVMDGGPEYRDPIGMAKALMSFYEEVSHAEMIGVWKIWNMRMKNCQRN